MRPEQLQKKAEEMGISVFSAIEFRLRYLVDLAGQWDDYIGGKINDIPALNLTKIFKEIDSLRRFEQRLNKGIPPATGITDEMIAKAREYPIDQLIEFDRRGFARCYKHDEKTPSMKYYEKINTVHCFGCGYNADSIAVMMDRDSMDFLGAVRLLVG